MTITDLLTRMIDRQYVQETAAVIRAIGNGSTSGLMAQRLKELDAEAARLAKLGERLTADNPVVRALLADFETTMQANSALVNGAAGAVQQSGVNAAGVVTRQLALPGYSDVMLRAMGVQWNVPNPEAVARLVQYTNSDAWAELLAKYGNGVVQQVQLAAVRGMINGWGPLQSARELRRLVEGLPGYQANALLRTLQLTALRDAQVAHRVANRHIIQYQIRVAALDGRCCLACLALHGKEMALDERVDDHWNGRCTSIVKARWLDAPDVQSGEAWFAARSEAEQRAQMGDAAFEAWKAGKVDLRDFAQSTSDPVFGGMIREASLQGLLGVQAQEFYQ